MPVSLAEKLVRMARRTVLLIAVFAGVVVLAACEEDVVAVVGTDLPYSLYGVISPQLDSQWVRVYPIEGRLIPARPEPLDAVVESVNLTTGERLQWRDSIIVDFANQYAHVFWAPFRAEHEHTYRINVRRSDGAQTGVELTVPALSEIVIEAPEFRSSGVILPLLVPGDLPRVLAVEVDYVVAYLPIGDPEILTSRLTIPYYTEPHKTDLGWRVPINLSDAFNEITAQLAQQLDEQPLDARVGLILLNTTARLIVGNESWNPPDGRFDPELIVQPGVMENVEGGFGFVGAGYRLVRQWAPPENAITRAGFRAPEEN